LEWPILVTSDESWRPIAVALQQFRGDGGTKLHLLMAASVVALLPIMLLYLVTQRSFTQGISTTGLK
jgi:multiple sugar transport system permease protein